MMMKIPLQRLRLIKFTFNLFNATSYGKRHSQSVQNFQPYNQHENFQRKLLKMLPTKIESVNNLVDEEPKHDYENININWMQAIITIKPIDLGRKKIRASVRLPVGYKKDILKRMMRTAWKTTKIRTDLTLIEKAYFWQFYLQEYISINREFMS